jgi:hypothetical protein
MFAQTATKFGLAKPSVARVSGASHPVTLNAAGQPAQRTRSYFARKMLHGASVPQ